MGLVGGLVVSARPPEPCVAVCACRRVRAEEVVVAVGLEAVPCTIGGAVGTRDEPGIVCRVGGIADA
jgi:hypothetical protein